MKVTGTNWQKNKVRTNSGCHRHVISCTNVARTSAHFSFENQHSSVVKYLFIASLLRRGVGFCSKQGLQLLQREVFDSSSATVRRWANNEMTRRGGVTALLLIQPFPHHDPTATANTC